MIKLIVADLDGTLLNDKHQLPSDFWEVEQMLFEQNILFAIASGRQFYNIIEIFDKIKDRIIILAENGTYGYYNGKEIFVNPMPIENAIDFITIGRIIPNANIIFCGKNAAYVESTDEKFINEASQYYKRLEFVPDLTLVKDEVLKITMCDFGDVPTNSYRFFKSFSTDFKVAISGKIWLDITNFDANKGDALKKIQHNLDINYNETAVFGDFLNDFEMMQSAKYSFAMKNAHPELIRISNFITEFDNNNNGVTHSIKKIIIGDY